MVFVGREKIFFFFLLAVILFIHDDVDLNDLKYDNENDEDLDLEMDEDGFPVKEKRIENGQPG